MFPTRPLLENQIHPNQQPTAPGFTLSVDSLLFKGHLVTYFEVQFRSLVRVRIFCFFFSATHPSIHPVETWVYLHSKARPSILNNHEGWVALILHSPAQRQLEDVGDKNIVISTFLSGHQSFDNPQHPSRVSRQSPRYYSVLFKWLKSDWVSVFLWRSSPSSQRCLKLRKHNRAGDLLTQRPRRRNGNKSLSRLLKCLLLNNRTQSHCLVPTILFCELYQHNRHKIRGRETCCISSRPSTIVGHLSICFYCVKTTTEPIEKKFMELIFQRVINSRPQSTIWDDKWMSKWLSQDHSSAVNNWGRERKWKLFSPSC